MAESRAMLSESWHRVAKQRIRLRSTLQIRKQVFRGETWYVLQDPFTNKFFRFRPEAYNFIVHLSSDRTVEEVWELCMKLDRDLAPGQPEVIQMLAQLHQH